MGAKNVNQSTSLGIACEYLFGMGLAHFQWILHFPAHLAFSPNRIRRGARRPLKSEPSFDHCALPRRKRVSFLAGRGGGEATPGWGAWDPKLRFRNGVRNLASWASTKRVVALYLVRLSLVLSFVFPLRISVVFWFDAVTDGAVFLALMRCVGRSHGVRLLVLRSIVSEDSLHSELRRLSDRLKCFLSTILLLYW